MRYRFLVITSIILYASCDFQKSNPLSTATQDQKDVDGRALASIYCASCHQLPTPDLLDKSTWNDYVLPRMGYMMGIYQRDAVRNSLLGEGEEVDLVEKANIFPKDRRISEKNWDAIKTFYLEEAPESLSATTKDTAISIMDQFNVLVSPFRLSPPSTTMVKFTSEGLLFGDAHSKRIYQFDKKLNLTRAANTREGAVWITEGNEHFLVTVMGSFSPTDNQNGFVMQLPINPRDKPSKIIDHLRRPVHIEEGDLNQDGLVDIVCCEFAKWTGRLSWWAQTPAGSYAPQIISPRMGPIKAYIKDINADGLNDVVALFGQGDEGIFAFYNQGNGEFKEVPLLRFPASYGSSYFNFFDFNRDGLEDIIHCAGDNGDYPPLLKPYHGIRIFLNQGDYKFKESHFIHQNGAFKAIPFDFDQDGDIDIASISFFPDYATTPKESFLFFENDGNNNFIPYSLQDPSIGRWIVMDNKDWDSDGDMDLVLGALAFEVIPDSKAYVKKWVEGGLPFIILENKLF